MPRNEANKRYDKAIHLFVPSAWYEWIREAAHQRRVSIAEVIRESLETANPDLPKRDDDEGRKGGLYRPDPAIIAALRCVDG